MPYDAIKLHQKLKEYQVIHGTAHTFVALLKACSQVKDLERGYKIHVMIEKDGESLDIYHMVMLRNHFIAMKICSLRECLRMQ